MKSECNCSKNKSSNPGIHLTCDAGDLGLENYAQCLEKSIEKRSCVHRLSFGYEYLCSNPERVAQLKRERD